MKRPVSLQIIAFAVISSVLRCSTQQQDFLFANAQDVIKCPLPGRRIKIEAINQPILLTKSRKGTLCILSRYDPIVPNPVIKNMEDWNIIPIARSYLKKNWENVAGPYVRDVTFHCNGNTCGVTIPDHSDATESSKYFLMSYKHSIDTKARISRFLDRVGFGPTKSDINQFNPNNLPLQEAMAKWVKKQMNSNNTPPTYHRVFFRNQSLGYLWRSRSTRTENPRHPCSPNSRWRRYTFSLDDRGYGRWNVSTLSDGRKLLKLDGVPRTILTSFKSTNGANVPNGDFEISWSTQEMVGGWVEVYPSTGGSYTITGGNPPLALDNSYFNDASYSKDIRKMNLPALSNFQFLEAVVFGHLSPEAKGNEAYLLPNALNDPLCSVLPLGDFGGLFGRMASGQLVYYDARLELIENTVENPAPASVGGQYALAGSLCPNAPKSFLNIENCVLSTETSACSTVKANPVLNLNQAMLKTVYQTTTRYVYMVQNLPLTDSEGKVPGVPSPCTPNIRHRWKKINDSTCSSGSVGSGTVNTLRRYLYETIGTWDQNEFIKDMHMEWVGGFDSTCSTGAGTIGMKVKNADGTLCYQHVHPDEYNVYDFTYWTLPQTHPGNLGQVSNPITNFATSNVFTLTFPGWHALNRWEDNKGYFTYVGRGFNNMEYFNLPSLLRTQALLEAYGYGGDSGAGVVICGSVNEVANDPTTTGTLQNAAMGHKDGSSHLLVQKSNVWNMIALSKDTKDVLRQKMAWALNQILVVTSNQIEIGPTTESSLHYYDIFVRHAFGNYFDILKEVAYSPMMAEMLSYLESKGSAYVWRQDHVKAWPDENFAREIMQLFSIGVSKLNLDGTVKVDNNTGLTIPTYANRDIQSFARAWTGFFHQEQRGNIEIDNWQPNRIDPLRINARWRDVFPKLDLNENYIGDGVPLCSDLPDKQYLKKGAKYVLLGSSALPEFQSGDESWWEDPDETPLRLVLDTNNSNLYDVLCDATNGSCQFKSVLTLNTDLTCVGKECVLDNVRIVKVSQDPPIYYEYLRPPCVDLTFYNDAKKIKMKGWPYYAAMCANPLVDEAQPSCCRQDWSGSGGSETICEFSGERVSYETAVSRCEAAYGAGIGPCDWTWAWGPKEGCDIWTDDNWFWTNASCKVQAKVNSAGMITVVHEPSNLGDKIVYEDYDSDNTNFFSIKWEGDVYPSVDNACGNGACQVLGESCLCDGIVIEEAVLGSIPDSYEDVIANLHIGSVAPGSGYYQDLSAPSGVTIYHSNSGSPYDESTIFQVDVRGKTKYFKNVRSMFQIQQNGSTVYSFRNPPHFNNFFIPDIRDAQYETDAVLEHYFNHDNTAPFLATRIIQRFGISNASPRYVETAATAFTTGSYVSQGISFGSGKYGDLGAMLAAIVLDREFQLPILDADPSYGSLREPMLKLISFMRSMEYEPIPGVKEISLEDLQGKIGQMPFRIPNVFSYFLPEYAPPGQIKSASLVAPESQVLTSPAIVSTVNGLFSLIDLGLTHCYGGFGQLTTWWCPCFEPGNDCYTGSRGFLSYDSNGTPESIADELALLLVGKRLSPNNREVIKDMILYAPTIQDGIRIAQKVLVTTPEFHSTGVVRPRSGTRKEMELKPPSESRYKAIVFVMLDGGMDSWNILMPHSDCEASGKDLYAEYASVRRELAIAQEDMLTIDASSSSQPCDTFGVHPDLTTVQELYSEGDLVFFANTGVLQQYVDKYNWWSNTRKTSLFAHNVQHDEVGYVDIYDQQTGLGICGRLVDLLSSEAYGYDVGALSVSGVAEALVSKLTPLFVVNPYEFEEVNPIPFKENVMTPIKLVNNANALGSSLYGETWSNLLFQALGENKLLFDALTETELDTDFPESHLGHQFESISRLVKSKDVRGTDRDVFYAEIGGFDTHSNLEEGLSNRAVEIEEALSAYSQELKAQGRWNDVTTIFISEFARTMTPNTSNGSDHAWGGNYFAVGGSVNGGRIVGNFITDYTDNSEINFQPGIVIPTTSWDQVWTELGEWFGVTNESDLDIICPNRANFNAQLDFMLDI